MIVLELVYRIIRNTHEQLMSIKDDYIITKRKRFLDCDMCAYMKLCNFFIQKRTC